GRFPGAHSVPASGPLTVRIQASCRAQEMVIPFGFERTATPPQLWTAPVIRAAASNYPDNLTRKTRRKGSRVLLAYTSVCPGPCSATYTCDQESPTGNSA